MPAFDANLRVLIVANDPLARAGLAALLTDQADITVVGRIAATLDLLTEVEIYRPEVVVFDLGWDPSLTTLRSASDQDTTPTSLDNLIELSETDLPVVALLPDETHARQAWSAGARGLLLRQTSSEKLLATLRAVSQGVVALDPALTATVLPQSEPDTPSLTETLTPRELEVLRLLAEGLPNKAIAHRLAISDHTVKFHVNAILSKLGAQSRTAAVVRATRLGWLVL
jgi:two-component system, NarL family, nitrate/nitrite response regulator NarL